MASNNGLSLSEQAYRKIKRKIISLELSPGAVIDEGALRVELDLGRTPIREALLRLSQEKLVEIVPRRGMFVAEIGITDLQRVFEMRLELEALAGRFAAQRGTVEHWARMDDVLASLPDEQEVVDNQLLIAFDEAFHQIIYEATDNELLQDTLMTLYALSLRLWYLSLPRIGEMRNAILEHRDILDCLRAGDGEHAAQLLRQHVQNFQEKIQTVMLGTVSSGSNGYTSYNSG